ncbi:hypothetical protein KKD04_02130 [Patescibacteria group bacterium]|nr:hypothetical protein [Patescibacteria group bacterium]
MKKTNASFVVIAIIINIAIVLVAWFLFIDIEKTDTAKETAKILGQEWNWGWAMFFAQILYIVFSFKTVGPTELGAILFFGKPVKEVSSGLVFIPLGICKLQTETRLTIQDELPSDPQHIYRGEDKIPEGMFPPIRIPFGFPKTAEELGKLDIKFPPGMIRRELVVPPEDDPLNVRVTAEVDPIIRWHIKNYIQFLITIGSRKEACRQMEDCTIAALTREFAKITPAVALANLGTYSFLLEAEIWERIEGWGIGLKNAQIKAINFHRDLNTAIGEVPRMKLKAKTITINAKAEKEQKQLLGEGDGLAEKAILDGRTAGLLEMKTQLALESDIVLSAETARAITNNPGQKTVIVGTKGFSDLIGVATGISKTLKDDGDGGQK